MDLGAVAFLGSAICATERVEAREPARDPRELAQAPEDRRRFVSAWRSPPKQRGRKTSVSTFRKAAHGGKSTFAKPDRVAGGSFGLLRARTSRRRNFGASRSPRKPPAKHPSLCKPRFRRCCNARGSPGRHFPRRVRAAGFVGTCSVRGRRVASRRGCEASAMTAGSNKARPPSPAEEAAERAARVRAMLERWTAEDVARRAGGRTAHADGGRAERGHRVAEPGPPPAPCASRAAA